MGAVNSACEGCFGKEKKGQDSQLNPKAQEDKYKYNEMKNDKSQEANEFNKNQSDSLRSLNSTSTKKQNTSSNTRASIKSRSGQESGQVKNKKLTIKDFDLIRVSCIELDFLKKKNDRCSEEARLEKSFLFRKRQIESIMPLKL